MAGNFVPGDVVRLVGGGPRLTVAEVQDDGYRCLWFDDLLRLREHTFLELCLTVAGPDDEDDEEEDEDEYEEA